MPAAVLLAIQILQALPSITTGFAHLWAYIVSIRAMAQQSNEWTPEAEAAFIKYLESKKVDPAYQPHHHPAVADTIAALTPRVTPV